MLVWRLCRNAIFLFQDLRVFVLDLQIFLEDGMSRS